MCKACGLVTHAARKRSNDPSGTLALQKRYESAFGGRWGKVRAAARRLVVQDDAFGITDQGRGVITNAKYQFATVPDRVGAFQTWFAREVNLALFDGNLGRSRDEATDRFFGNTFANTAYRRGLINAAGQLQQAGATVGSDYVVNAMSRGRHYDMLKRLHTRAYDDLRGISAEASKQIGNSIAQGLVEQWSTEKIAKAISDRIEKIGITRSRTIARTEILSGYNEAELNTYDDAALNNVMLEPELLTAGDNRVCEECEAAAQQKYTLASARGLLPLHPNCRCVWLPLIVDGKRIDLK